MRCTRCGSLMVEEIYYHDGDSFAGLRCLICGEVVDPEILKNRAESLGDRRLLRKPEAWVGVR